MRSATEDVRNVKDRHKSRRSGCDNAFGCFRGSVLSDYVTFSLLF